ncbi:MAG TPA: hypothetical protein DEP47_08440 [Chloroflexi bacterium]|nr:hypothetical protein [Chloroflexota bacterium]
MTRQACLDAPGLLHHIMIRGMERRKILVNDRDREDSLERLSKLVFPENSYLLKSLTFMPILVNLDGYCFAFRG